MYLKRLEINGFKSFAQKTVFDFPSGIVGVVGPNGSGKSNIIDAVRWLLGEREAKNLRGGKVEDLIFAGTPKKARMSQAQVSLVFDNASGDLPLEYKEVVITRKVSRNGISQYFINDAAVRLKDIIDFFSKIKLGTKGLTIIGQGAGDIFVRASGADRMRMVQEILGLREYESKKLEAGRKLKHTHGNLEKVSAMLEEVAPRLRMLKRQTAKWHKRAEIEEELRTVESAFFAYKIRRLHEERSRIVAQTPDLEKEYAIQDTNRKALEEKLEKLEESSMSKSRLQELSQKRRNLFERQAAGERDRMRLEIEEERNKRAKHGDLSVPQAKEALRGIKGELEGLLQSTDITSLLSGIRAVIQKLDTLFSSEKDANREKKTDTSHERKKIEQELQTIAREIKSIDEEEEKLSEHMQRFSEEFKGIYAKLDEVRSKLKKLSDERTKISFELEKSDYKLQELKNHIQSLGGDFHAFEKAANISPSAVPMSHEEQLSESQLAEMDKRSIRLRGELASIGDIDEALLKEAQEVEVHYAHLSKESDDLSKASADLFLLIDELQEKLETDFQKAFKKVNEEFNTYFKLMFGGGSARMKILKKEKTEKVQEQEADATQEAGEEKQEDEMLAGIDIELSIPQKKITSLDMLSGGEKSLVSIAVLFALISVSPPPFLVLDEVDSALDEKNSKRFADLIGNFSKHTQFIVVTHNRVTMEAADILYGITMDEGGGTKVISLRLEDAKAAA